jgi:ABC-2 type transport system ATP-binding protein
VSATVVVDGVAKWYGDRVAVADVSFELAPGVTGLLGHNGAGKTTILKLCSGFAPPSKGDVRVMGLNPRTDPSAYRHLGITPDGDAIWPFLTAREVVVTLARLRGVDDPAAAAERAIGLVGMEDAIDRRVGGFSKGMRQAVKLAQALVHDPDVLLLDEPLNGLDPARRRHVVELVQQLGAAGKTVLVSSHVLHEVERMAPRVVVLVNGRLVAEGFTSEIRALIADRPRAVRIDAGPATRSLMARLVSVSGITSIHIGDDGAVVEADDVDALARAIAPLAREIDATLRRVEPVGDDLESVYAYLHARARGAAR